MSVNLINKPRYSVVYAIPDYEPVTLAQCKDALEISDDFHDSKIRLMLGAAIREAEKYTGASFSQKTATLYYDSIQSFYRLPVYPVLSIDSIEYLSNTVYTAFTDFESDLFDFPPFVRFVSLPSADLSLKTLKFNLTVGYASNNSPPDSDLIPEDIKQAIIFHVYQSFLSRGDLESTAMRTFRNMLHPYRVLGL